MNPKDIRQVDRKRLAALFDFAVEEEDPEAQSQDAASAKPQSSTPSKQVRVSDSVADHQSADE